MRDYQQESRDLTEKKYSYNFDEYIRKYLVHTYRPFFKGGSCLEIGCGYGELTKFIDSSFDSIIGVDPLLNTTIENHVSTHTYDAIIMHNVLEHVDDVGVCLSLIKSHMNRDARFFVSVPNANAVSRQIAVKMGIVDGTICVTPAEYEHGHRRTYNTERLMKTLKNSGFKIIHSGGVIFKAISNWQMDRAMEEGIVSDEYIMGSYELGLQYPEMCATIYAVCEV